MLSAIVVTGGIAAPVLLMLGLERLSGVSGSLLLNLEGPLTLVVGIVVLHEYLGRRAGIGSLVIFAGSAFIGFQGGAGSLDAVGASLVVAACLGWAIDNNLTQRLSVRDPFQIVAVKTGVAAVVNVGLGDARAESPCRHQSCCSARSGSARAPTGSASCSTRTRLRALGARARGRGVRDRAVRRRAARGATARRVVDTG